MNLAARGECNRKFYYTICNFEFDDSFLASETAVDKKIQELGNFYHFMTTEQIQFAEEDGVIQSKAPGQTSRWPLS